MHATENLTRSYGGETTRGAVFRWSVGAVSASGEQGSRSINEGTSLPADDRRSEPAWRMLPGIRSFAGDGESADIALTP
jgi:hypothetical protein